MLIHKRYYTRWTIHPSLLTTPHSSSHLEWGVATQGYNLSSLGSCSCWMSTHTTYNILPPGELCCLWTCHVGFLVLQVAEVSHIYYWNSACRKISAAFCIVINSLVWLNNCLPSSSRCSCFTCQFWTANHLQSQLNTRHGYTGNM